MSDYVCLLRKLFGKTGEGNTVKRLVDDEENDNEESEIVARKIPKMNTPTDILTMVSLHFIYFKGVYIKAGKALVCQKSDMYFFVNSLPLQDI